MKIDPKVLCVEVRQQRKASDIYGVVDSLTIPFGYEFVDFRVLEKGDSYISKTGSIFKASGPNETAGEPRIVVREIPRKKFKRITFEQTSDKKRPLEKGESGLSVDSNDYFNIIFNWSKDNKPTMGEYYPGKVTIEEFNPPGEC